ncbi:TetR/AcrR family transcriptional regulator [Kytococcus sp. Marseille-QA3725]
MPTPPIDPADAPRENPATREGYHHGDLRAALVDAAEAAIREQGPEAISMRGLARAAGVTPSAAYRHFASRDELVQQVTFRAQAASAACMDARRAELPEGAAGAAHLTAVGLAYIDYARSEPGMFRAAFLEPEHLDLARDPRSAGPSGLTPYQHLEDALDRMQAEGALPAALREGAEAPCWSAVHGFSMLAVQGPFRGFPPEVLDLLAARTVTAAVRGVTLPPG